MINYKTNPTKTRSAVYIGMVRVGYVELRNNNGALWHMTLIRPTGNAYMGEAESLDAAKAGVEAAISDWMQAARLAFVVGGESTRLCPVCGGADQHKAVCEVSNADE